MSISRVFWRRIFPSLLLVSGFVLLYEATVSDSRYAARQAELLDGVVKPMPGTRMEFEATAYCKGHTTASGVAVRSGVAAADPDLLPVGSVIQASFEHHQYDGVYTIMDTGPSVKGRLIDVYMWSCFDALRFGRQGVHIVVLRLGWNPKDTTPLIETLFPRRIPEGAPAPPPRERPRRLPPPEKPTPPAVPAPGLEATPGPGSPTPDPGSPAPDSGLPGTSSEATPREPSGP
jgi:3D (Asp-Asp-Asp) domain-containing protein